MQGLSVVRVTGSSVERLLRVKEELRARVESMLEPGEAEEARRDHHARRKPIACGMTIHTGVGCRFGCLYCYVPDMGFPMKPRAYPLTGLQLVYALLVNPYFLPGPHGTLLAFGSVTEPFMDETVDRALEYLEATWRLLGNPQQVSTKAVLRGERLEKFLETADPRISVLVSVTTIRHASVLEPGAPSPEERFAFMSKLAGRGRSVTLFLRPIIPGVTDREVEDIIAAAARAGARTVVPGSLRVTPGIIRRLRASRVVDIDEVLRRLPRKPRSARDQVPLRMQDLKALVARVASRYGLRVLPSSCAANIDSHGLGCWACRWGPCGRRDVLPVVDREGVSDALEALGCRPLAVRVSGNVIEAMCRGDRFTVERARVLLETVARRRVVLRAPG